MRDRFRRLLCRVLGHNWTSRFTVYSLFGKHLAARVCLRCGTIGTIPASALPLHERPEQTEADMQRWIDTHPLISRPL